MVNGKNVVNFDGNDQLWTDQACLATNFTIISVSRMTGGLNQRLITSKDRNWFLGYHGSADDRYLFEQGGKWTGSSANTDWHLHTATMNNSDELNTWKDFVQTSTNLSGSHPTDYAPSKLFGAWDSLKEPSKGEIAEFILYNKVLSTPERQKIEGYLAHKWGLSLPGGHPYKTSFPSLINNPFSTDVASGSGQSLDLSAGTFATVSTGGTEDVFDGDNNFSISMWTKG